MTDLWHFKRYTGRYMQTPMEQVACLSLQPPCISPETAWRRILLEGHIVVF
jgi:hypothetical protein